MAPALTGRTDSVLTAEAGGRTLRLFADGHVIFLPQRTYGNGDDIFVNRDGKTAAGVDATDIVLGYSSARPR